MNYIYIYMYIVFPMHIKILANIYVGNSTFSWPSYPKLALVVVEHIREFN